MERRIPNGLVEVFLPAIVWRASQCGWVRIGKTAEGLDVWQKPDGQTMRIRPGVEPLVPTRGARIAPARTGCIEKLPELTKRVGIG